MNPTDAILKTEALGRQADDGTWLIQDVNLPVWPGDRLGIVGASGSGKTVLLRAMGALDPIHAGQLLFDGATVSGQGVPAYRTQVVYLQQRAALFEGTVEFNLRKPFDLAIHKDRNYDQIRILSWLEQLGRDAAFLEKDQQNLSGGELQIVALLRAMQLNPRVLLLDEPTAALDSTATAAVDRLVDRWLSDNPAGAFVWITHDMEQAQRMCDAIYNMDAGRLTKDTSWNT